MNDWLVYVMSWLLHILCKSLYYETLHVAPLTLTYATATAEYATCVWCKIQTRHAPIDVSCFRTSCLCVALQLYTIRHMKTSCDFLTVIGLSLKYNIN